MDEETLKANLKFAAVIIFCISYKVFSSVQVITDLAMSKEGFFDGKRRQTPSEPQKVRIIMTNADLTYKDQYKYPRFGPGANTEMFKAAMAKTYPGFSLEVENYGKPCTKSFNFAEKELKTRFMKQGFP